MRLRSVLIMCVPAAMVYLCLPQLRRVVNACDAAWADSSMTQDEKSLLDVAGQVADLHPPLGTPQSGDWLDQHFEPGQTFAQYIRSDPVVPNAERHLLYVQPIGPFTSGQRRLLELNVEYLEICFRCPVRILPELSGSVIPKSHRRIHPHTGKEQFHATYIWDQIRKPRVPPDAVACIAFTATDLWPGRNWNFVFGQASVKDRVGVWSFARFGDPDADEQSFAECLGRSLKTASHETGHMFSIHHCIAAECNMCGCNTLEESDRRPITFCHHCLAKILWATKADSVERFRDLRDFCERNGLKKQTAAFDASLHCVGNNQRIGTVTRVPPWPVE